MAESSQDSLVEYRKESLTTLLASLTTLQQSINWSLFCTGPHWQTRVEILTALAKARSAIDNALSKQEI